MLSKEQCRAVIAQRVAQEFKLETSSLSVSDCRLKLPTTSRMKSKSFFTPRTVCSESAVMIPTPEKTPK